jgi:hypothetical protein
MVGGVAEPLVCAPADGVKRSNAATIQQFRKHSSFTKHGTILIATTPY